MNVARLKVLAKYLRELKVGDKVGFDMSDWGSVEYIPGGLKLVGNKCEPEEGFCKTTACMLGHAAMIPAFNKAGLTVKWEVFGNGEGSGANARIKLKGYSGAFIDNIDIGAKFFDIPRSDAEYLFGGGGPHQTPKESAKAIEKLIKEHEKPE